VLIWFALLGAYRDPVITDLEPASNDPRLQRLLDKAALRRSLYEALLVLGRGTAGEIDIHREGDRRTLRA
jgi:hypothetical protein